MTAANRTDWSSSMNWYCFLGGMLVGFASADSDWRIVMLRWVTATAGALLLAYGLSQ